MKATYYIPNQPESIPLFTKDNVSLMINGDMVDVPISLFNKLYKPYEDNVIKVMFEESMNEMSVKEKKYFKDLIKKQIGSLKNEGIPKEMFKEIVCDLLEKDGLGYSIDYANELIDELY